RRSSPPSTSASTAPTWRCSSPRRTPAVRSSPSAPPRPRWTPPGSDRSRTAQHLGGLPRLGPSCSHRRSSPVTDPYGIIDLAALKQPAGGETGGAGSAGTPSAHEVVVTEQGLEQLIADSQSIPTLLLVTSARVPEADQFLSGLRRAVDAKGGAVRLGIVDADSQQRVAGALRVQQLPTLLLLIQGQLQPIVQSVIPDAEIDNLLTQVVEVARQQGMELPEGEATSQEPAEEPLPP